MSRKKPAPHLMRGGNRFSDKDMRQLKESRAHPDSTQSGCALAVEKRARATSNTMLGAFQCPSQVNRVAVSKRLDGRRLSQRIGRIDEHRKARGFWHQLPQHAKAR